MRRKIKGKLPFSSHTLNVTYTVRVDCDHLGGVVLVRFLHYQVTTDAFCILYSLEGSHCVQFILKEWGVVFHLLILGNSSALEIVSSVLLICYSIIYISMASSIVDLLVSTFSDEKCTVISIGF